MTFVDLLISCLAVNSIVELIRHDARLEEWRVYWYTTPYFWSRVLRCGFCTSYWAAIAVGLLYLVPEMLGPGWPTSTGRLVVDILAFARAAQLLNDLTHRHQRYPIPRGPAAFQSLTEKRYGTEPECNC